MMRREKLIFAFPSLPFWGSVNMKDATRGSWRPAGRQMRSGSYCGSRAAFTLFELLAVLAILSMLGALGWSAARLGGIRSAEREADRTMRWIYRLIARADRTGQPFVLMANSHAELSTISASWQDSLRSDRLEATEGFLFRRIAGGRVFESVYSPQWGTFTPALTLRVRGPDGDEHYLIVSGQGRIRTSPTPPRGAE